MKTYGTLGWARDPKSGLEYWGLQVLPHVAIKAKRLFPRLASSRVSIIAVHDTPEMAADLEWFTQRYPLEMANEVRERLAAQADLYRSQQQEIELVLTGGKTLLDVHRKPARAPRDYQQVGADLAYSTGGLLLADDLGLGKTQTALMVLADPSTLPALIIAPTHLPEQWLDELREVWPDLKGHVVTKGSPIVRRKRKLGTFEEPYDTEDADVLIMSYSKVAGWRDLLAGNIKTVIFDEVQELRRAGSDKYEACAAIADKADRRMGLSASPIHNYGGEAFNIYEVLAPGTLGTSSEFYREWGSEIRGSNVIVKDTGGLGDYLRDQGLLLRRTRAEVGRTLPTPIETVIQIDSNTDEINKVEADLVALAERVLYSTPTDRWQASGDLDMRMRQATGIDKAPYVADFSRMLLESEDKIVMFGYHREVWNIWNHRLADFGPAMFTGTESPKQKRENVQAFLHDDDRRIFMCSLASGAGLDGLQKVANVGVFGELDWSPAVHHQALGRLARDGIVGTAVGYYLVSTVGSDPIIGGRLEVKRQQAEGLMRKPGEHALFGVAGDDTARIKELAKDVLRRAGRSVE